MQRKTPPRYITHASEAMPCYRRPRPCALSIGNRWREQNHAARGRRRAAARLASQSESPCGEISGIGRMHNRQVIRPRPPIITVRAHHGHGRVSLMAIKAEPTEGQNTWRRSERSLTRHEFYTERLYESRRSLDACRHVIPSTNTTVTRHAPRHTDIFQRMVPSPRAMPRHSCLLRHAMEIYATPSPSALARRLSPPFAMLPFSPPSTS